MLLESEIGREDHRWSVELGDADLALIRYTQYIDEKSSGPDTAELDAAVVEMVRGWAPAVEAELINAAGASAGDPPALTYINSFPDGYRARTAPEEGAADILRLCQLTDENDRGVRIYRFEHDAPGQLRLKTYRRGGLIPLSEVVPVSKTSASASSRNSPPHSPETMAIFMISGSRSAPAADLDAIMARVDEIERAIANVLCGAAEMTNSTSSCSTPASTRSRSSGCGRGSVISARRAAALAW